MERFAQVVREEIIHKELPRCQRCIKAELAAIIHMAGSIHLAGHDRLSLSLLTESAGIVRRVMKLIKVAYKLNVEVRMENVEKLGRHHRYQLLIPEQAGMNEMLYELGVITRDRDLETNIQPELVKDPCCRASYLRGAFLIKGSVTDPHKTTYHMELVTHNETFANSLAYLMNVLGLKAKVGQRKDYFLVYLKDSEALARFLTIINADNAMLKLEEIRVIKGMRGEVNRLVNCETANLEKSLTAAWDQVKIIKELQLKGDFSSLSENLQETAKLRLEYPEATFKELGEYHQPPISKSAVNHRLRQLRDFTKSFH